MIATKEDLCTLLATSGIDYSLYEHIPVFTVADGAAITKTIPGPHVKNLFLRDPKKTNYILLTVHEHKRVDLNNLSKVLNLGRLSFANSEDLMKHLHITPGSVTPIAILNDHLQHVRLYFDAELQQHQFICIHPMINSATIRLKLQDLLQIIQQHHHHPEFINIQNIT